MDPHPHDAFAVVIVNYGSPDLLAKNIGHELDAEPAAQVVVVDNYHSAQARETTARLCDERGWLLVTSPNDGFGAGVNRGIAAARALGHRVFITLNPDAEASVHVLRELAHHARSHPDSLVSPIMDTGDGRPHFRGAGVHRRTGEMRSGWSPGDADPLWGNWLSGACLALSAEAFDRVAGFSEDYFLYWEDVDISRRAAALGMQLTLREDLLVVHDEGGTHNAPGSRSKSPLYYYFNIRNRLLFGRRMLRGRDRLRWLLATPRQSLLIWMRGGRRQLFTHPRGAWSAVRGALSGLSHPGPRATAAAAGPTPWEGSPR